jgi:hypothetical protein
MQSVGEEMRFLSNETAFDLRKLVGVGGAP